MSEPKKLVVIDGKSVLYRGYYAMGNLATPQGKPTGATYGFAMMGLRILKEFDPDYVVVAWDKSQTNIRARQQLYAEYKANRKPMPEDLREQIDDVRAICDAFGWPLLEVDDYEADDIMGTLAVQAKQYGIDSVLVTSDLDVLQLVNHYTRVCALKRGLTRTVLYDENKLEQEYGLTPDQFVDYKALRGDPSDNIPGVKGVGDKTARQLITEYGDMDTVYENLDAIGGATARKLEADRDMAFLSRELIKLSLDAPIEFDEVASRASEAHPEQVHQLFDDLGFRRLLRELPRQMRSSQTGLFDVSATTNGDSVVKPEVVVETTDNLKEVYEQAVVFTFGEQALVSPDKSRCFVVPATALSGVKRVIGHDVKVDLKTFAAEVDFDIMVAAFLLNPLIREQSLPALAASELEVELPELKRGSNVDIEMAGYITWAIWELYERYAARMEGLPRLQSIANDIEWPLLPVLARMEQAGFKLDVQYLREMAIDFQQRIETIEGRIHGHAGEEFNINSPQQLQTILFDRLQLSTSDIKKTKTGYSTGASELEKLRGLHPVIDLIVQYRELTKLKNTYIDALPKLAGDDGRLHTTFTQTVAQTGRLSSLHPNLQNIPVRTEEGRAIRRAFVVESGHVLVQADYSQIELRVAAALSEDERMLAAFRDGADIHVQTAAELHGVSPREVTKEQRYSAKTVNFGVLYGMSPHGLSIATGMSREEAKAFIDRYFGIRSRLLEYLESLKTKARTDGYVETLFGRRRPMPDILSSNFAVRSAAERAAMNMPIQGTAADIMKLAMIEIDRRLDAGSRQILQVHDSILVEAPEQNAERISEILQKTMENVYELGVPMDVEVSTGRHWGEL